MAPWVADVMARLQAVVTMPTRLWHHVHDRLHALQWHERSMMPRMARLPARLAPTYGLPTPYTLLPGEAIG
jgi:hypothetical protein